MAKPKLSWYVPRWAFVPGLWKGFRLVINWGSFCRIAIATVLASAAIIGAVKWALPMMPIPNLWPVVVALPAIPLMFAAQFGILTLIPPSVTIRPNKIIVSHGQSAIFINREEVTATYLTFHSDNRIRLRIRYTKKSRARARTIGVPPTVDFDRLTELLPVPPVVRDARNRSRHQEDIEKTREKYGENKP